MLSSVSVARLATACGLSSHISTIRLDQEIGDTVERSTKSLVEHCVVAFECGRLELLGVFGLVQEGQLADVAVHASDALIWYVGAILEANLAQEP